MDRVTCFPRFRRIAFAAALGGWMLSTSCGQDIQDSIKSAGLSYVSSSATLLLQNLVPVKDLLNGGQSSTST